MKKENIKILSNISIVSLFVGLIMLFIKWPIGVLLLIAYFVITPCLLIKYPKEMQEIRNSILENAQKQQSHNGKKYNIVHIQGINFADMNQNCKLSFLNKTIYFQDKNDKILEELEFSNIKNCSILEEIEQTQKEKSPVARAVVGGILLGPVGAVVGGVSSLSSSIKENKKYYLEIKNTQSSKNIVLTASNKDLQEIKQTILKEI